MKKFRVDWTETALQAVDDLIAYFPADDLANAEKILDDIFKAGDGLENFPERGRPVPEFRDLGEIGLREVFHKPWRIIYEVHPSSVEILLVVDGRRDLNDILLQMLLNRPGNAGRN